MSSIGLVSGRNLAGIMVEEIHDSGYNMVYRKERKAEQSEAFLSPDKSLKQQS